MAKSTTLTAPWWIWRSVQKRLIKWTLLLLGGRKYTVDLTTEIETGAHYPDLKKIEVNPEMFSRQPADVQFRCTQGLLFHEVGHARYTSAWPDQAENILRDLVNALEDERIEKCMRTAFPGGAPALELLGDLVYTELTPGTSTPAFKVIDACLAWRWAHTRGGERKMLRQLKLDGDAVAGELWMKIKPLVEAAWHAPDTSEVIRLGREILKILGLPEGTPPLKSRLPGINPTGIPTERADSALPAPTGPEIEGPGLDALPIDISLHRSTTGRSWSRPAAYSALEDAAYPLARRIIETLQEPRPNVRPRPDALSGRYTFRLEERDWERPFQRRADVGRAPRSLALYVLVDWSSSMDYSAAEVRLALMALHLACAGLSLPHAITLFGADRDALPDDRIETILHFGERGDWPKALIAGYQPAAGNEYLFAALDRATAELQLRPERDKIMIVIHDGAPVWSGREGRDWDLSIHRLHTAERQGIRPIGLYLGRSTSDHAQMQKLFARLIECQPDRLPEKLGSLLISLA